MSEPSIRVIETGQPFRHVVPVPIISYGVNELISSRAVRLYGWSLAEPNGAFSAQITLRNGGDANGTMVADITLGPSESIRDWFGPHGVYCDSGLFKAITTGSVTGALWVEYL